MILAATGHRPGKLGGYGPELAIRLLRLARDYLQTAGNPKAVISGMALGWDTAWALGALDLGIPLIAEQVVAGHGVLLIAAEGAFFLMLAGHELGIGITGHARTEQTGHARERSRKIREREKRAQERFDEYFAQHGDRLRREQGERRQTTKDRGR